MASGVVRRCVGGGLLNSTWLRFDERELTRFERSLCVCVCVCPREFLCWLMFSWLNYLTERARERAEEYGTTTDRRAAYTVATCKRGVDAAQQLSAV